MQIKQFRNLQAGQLLRIPDKLNDEQLQFLRSARTFGIFTKLPEPGMLMLVTNVRASLFDVKDRIVRLHFINSAGAIGKAKLQLTNRNLIGLISIV